MDGLEVLWSVGGQADRYKRHLNRAEVEMLVPVPREAVRSANATALLLGV